MQGQEYIPRRAPFQHLTLTSRPGTHGRGAHIGEARRLSPIAVSPELVGGVQVLRSPPCLGDLPVPEVKYPCVVEVVGVRAAAGADVGRGHRMVIAAQRIV